MITLSTHWMKYLPFIFVGAGFLLSVYYIFKREHLLRFVIQSMTTDGKPDSKKMSGFVLVMSLVLGFFIAIYYSKDHSAPEYYVWCIAMLITSFYGIREVSRFVTSKWGGGEVLQAAPQSSPPPSPVNQPQQTPADPKKNDDIG